MRDVLLNTMIEDIHTFFGEGEYYSCAALMEKYKGHLEAIKGILKPIIQITEHSLQNESKITGASPFGRNPKYLLSGLLRCPMCGSSMYSELIQWTTADGEKHYRRKYQCGHYAKAKHGQCKKNAILAEWVETEVIEFTKLLVKNPKFAEDIQAQIGQKIDVSEIDAEIRNYRKQLNRLEQSKARLERDIDGISAEDKYAERKRKDMNSRLNGIYEEIYGVEDAITACEQRKAAVEQEAMTKDMIFQMLLSFDKLIDVLDDEDKRQLIESLISEVHLYPKETWAKGKNLIKEIVYTFPIYGEVDFPVGVNLPPSQREAQ